MRLTPGLIVLFCFFAVIHLSHEWGSMLAPVSSPSTPSNLGVGLGTPDAAIPSSLEGLECQAGGAGCIFEAMGSY